MRATVGSLWHLPLAVGRDPADVVRRAQARRLHRPGRRRRGGDRPVRGRDALLAGRVAWLLGNEAWGLPDDLAALADHRVSIPILGRAESLNLSTAAAVCLYASARAPTPRC